MEARPSRQAMVLAGDGWGVVAHLGMSGRPSVIPRIFAEDPAEVFRFLREVFGATGDPAGDRPTEVGIGNSIILLSGVTERPPYPAFLYVYVDDVDRAYERAEALGAETLEPPGLTPYGDRRAMVRDHFGNVFQIVAPG